MISEKNGPCRGGGGAFALLLFFVAGIAISGLIYRPYTKQPDTKIKVEVVNVWEERNQKNIQVRANVKNVHRVITRYAVIRENYFAGLNPKLGDCVMMWAEVKKGLDFTDVYETNLITDRNISSCQ